MKKVLFTLWGMVGFLIIGCGAMAPSGTPEEKADQLLDKLDTNGDLKISKSESKFPVSGKTFDDYDSNKDGYLDKDELVVLAKSRG